MFLRVLFYFVPKEEIFSVIMNSFFQFFKKIQNDMTLKWKRRSRYPTHTNAKVHKAKKIWLEGG